jgi:hypothetical protein
MAISVVQSQSGSAGGSFTDTLTITLTSATTAGNCLVVVAGNDSAQTISGITLGGSAGNFANAAGVANSAEVEIWTDQNCAGGATSVVITWTGSFSNLTAVVYEVAGLLTSAAVDKTATNSGTGTPWNSGTTATTTQASEIWIGGYQNNAATSDTVTGPSSPWVNTQVNQASRYLEAGYKIVSATGAATYSGTESAGVNSSYAAAVVTLKGAASSAIVSPFTPRRSAKGKPAAVRGTGRGGQGAAYVAFPSKFTPPRKPAKGAAGSARGHVEASPGAKYIHVTPPGPSPFTLPVRPAKGATAIRGTGQGRLGAAYVAFPSPFVLPKRPAKGAAAAVRGRGTGHPGAQYVLIETAPFIPPRHPARGASAVRRGTGLGSITGHGAPVSPRQLILVLAARAGTDDYGNTYPQGILATEGVIEGPSLVGSDAFFYNGTPAAGNLVQSVTEADGTDAYGNAYIAGTATYSNNGTFWSAVVIADGVVNWYKATSEAGPWTSEAGIGFSWNSLTGGGLSFTAPAGSDHTGDFNVTGSVTVTTTLTVNGTDVGTTLSNIISALSGASTSSNGLANGTISGTSGGASTGTAHTHGPGSFSVTDGHHTHTLPTVP